MFSHACVKNSVHGRRGGGGSVHGGAYAAGGHAWQGVCMAVGVNDGAMHGRGGVCMAGGVVWQGGMRGGAWRGCAW